MKLFYNIQTIYNMKKRYKILLVILVIIVVIGIYILSPKYSVTNKEKNRIKKEILDNIGAINFCLVFHG